MTERPRWWWASLVATFTCVAKIWPRFTFAAEIIPALEAEFAQLGFDGAQVGACVHEGAENHVAADAGKAVEICVP